MYISETDLLVFQMKGLLNELERKSRTFRYGLSFDNIDKVKSETEELRKILNKLDELVPEVEKNEEGDMERIQIIFTME